MKMLYENSYLKESDINQLRERFPDLIFTDDDKSTDDIEAIISMPEFLTPENLDRFINLKWVQVLTAGYNQLNLSYFEKRRIVLTNAKDVFSIQIAEDVFSKILYFNRNLKAQQAYMNECLWKHEPVHYEIAESTVGILGTGSIGSEVAKRMKAFDARVLGYRRSRVALPYFDQLYFDQEGLDELYQKSDYIIVALPLNDETFHFINQKSFSKMKKNVVIINVARGEIIDQEALVDAIKTKKIRAAGLDVMTPEPLPENHELWKLEQVFISPHNSSASPHVRKRLIQAVSDSIHRYVNHQKFNNRVI